MLKNRAPLGRVPPEAIRCTTLPRLAPGVLERVAALGDLTANLSDAMDALGLAGAVPATELQPHLPLRRAVGQALTVRNVERRDSPTAAAAGKQGRMGEIEAYHLAEPGDVVVIEGLRGISNMGGQSATMAKRSGVAAVVIDGSFRDPETPRTIDLPVWSRGPTPITGKWRLETVEINGRVRVAGMSVDAGDLVAADEAGIVVVPFARVEEVLAEAERIASGDRRQQADIAAGIELATVAVTRYK